MCVPKMFNSKKSTHHTVAYKFIIAYSFLRWEFIKRKQENKKTITRPRKWSRKKEVFSFFLGRFLGWVLVFFLFFLFSWSLSWWNSCFLTFLFSFIPPQAPSLITEKRSLARWILSFCIENECSRQMNKKDFPRTDLSTASIADLYLDK